MAAVVVGAVVVDAADGVHAASWGEVAEELPADEVPPGAADAVDAVAGVLDSAGDADTCSLVSLSPLLSTCAPVWACRRLRLVGTSAGGGILPQLPRFEALFFVAEGGPDVAAVAIVAVVAEGEEGPAPAPAPAPAPLRPVEEEDEPPPDTPAAVA
mmetsp:Transcript_64511/g.140101  ORF Transcript_64511/g.140101 Transcript_64511/m.140101 type:complete len:156 (+) Transcript_64511:1711-2178(+)